MIDRLIGFSFPNKLIGKIKKDQEFYFSNKTTFEHPSAKFLNCILDADTMNKMDLNKYLELLYLNYLQNLSLFYSKLNKDGVEMRQVIDEEHHRVVSRPLVKDMAKVNPKVVTAPEKVRFRIEDWNQFVQSLKISDNYKVILKDQSAEELYGQISSLYYRLDGLYSKHKKTA